MPHRSHPLERALTRGFELAVPALAALAVLAAGATSAAPIASAAQPRCANARTWPAGDGQLAARAVLCLLNHERGAHGLKPLRLSPTLTRAAVGHSKDMVRRRYFDHTTPANVTFDHRIRRARYDGQARAKLGENLAWGMGDPALPIVVVRDWMNSPEHRANILDAAFRSIGIGIAPGVPLGARASAASSSATYTTDFGSR